ncbi:MAG TPA: hypothetical protein VH253_20225 [Phycisphaerae bacterium]|nr:hypothetical protein [Phycisphaerae bacterium]
MALFPQADEMEVLDKGAELRFTLPPAVRGPARLAGLPFFLFGLLFAGFALFWISHAVTMAHDQNAPHVQPARQQAPPNARPARRNRRPAPAAPARNAPAPPPASPAPTILLYAFALFGVPFFFVGALFAIVGLAVLFPRPTVITLSADHLNVINGVGPITLRRKLPLDQLRELAISTAAGRNAMHAPASSIISLTAMKPSGRRFTLASNYRPELLQALAERLVAELARRGRTIPLNAAPAASAATLTATGAATPQDQSLEPPPATRVICGRAADALTFLMPRAGLRSPLVRFLAFFTLLWNAFAWVFFAVALRNVTKDGIVPLLFVSLFVLVGTFLLVWTLRSALRKVVILAGPDALLLTEKGILRTSEKHWPRDVMAAIRDAESRTTVQNRTLMQLQILTTDGKTHRCLTGAEDDDLAWIAATLQSFYSLPPDLPVKVSQPTASAT